MSFLPRVGLPLFGRQPDPQVRAFLAEVRSFRQEPRPGNLLTRQHPVIDRYRELTDGAFRNPVLATRLNRMILPTRWYDFEKVRKALLALDLELSRGAPLPIDPSHSWELIRDTVDLRGHLIPPGLDDDRLFASFPPGVSHLRRADFQKKMLGSEVNPFDATDVRLFDEGGLAHVEAHFFFVNWLPIPAWNLGYYLPFKDEEARQTLLREGPIEGLYHLYLRTFATLHYYARTGEAAVHDRSPHELFKLICEMDDLIYFLEKRWRIFTEYFLSDPSNLVEEPIRTLLARSIRGGNDSLLAYIVEESNHRPALNRLALLSCLPCLPIALSIQSQAIERFKKERSVREAFAGIQGDNGPIFEPDINWLLGLSLPVFSGYLERDEDWRLLQGKIGERTQFEYSGVEYEYVRAFLRHSPLLPSQTVYDLGSGFGRLVFYLALASQAKQVKGVEIVPSRVAVSRQVQASLGLEHVEVREGSVLQTDVSDGDVFFIFNSFDPETLKALGKKLKRLARRKKIRIVSIGPSHYYFSTQRDWLRLQKAICLSAELEWDRMVLVFDSF